MKNYKTDMISTRMRELGLTFKALSKLSGVAESRIVLATQDVVKNNVTPKTLIRLCPHINIKKSEFWMLYAGTDNFIDKEAHESEVEELKNTISELKEDVYQLKDEKMKLMEKIIG